MESKTIVLSAFAAAAVALAYTVSKEENLFYRLRRILFGRERMQLERELKSSLDAILLGSESTCKTTQGAKIAEDHGWCHLVIGNLVNIQNVSSFN